MWTRSTATGCCWRKPINGRRTRWPISARAAATNATWRFISRSCRACSWPCAWRTALPIVDILEQTPPIPETSQWALFLRNHDELTLEMVTDEERDYMYRMYAQVHQARLNLGIRRRLAPLLGNDRKQHRTAQRAAASRCRARRCSITATKSGWATISTWATATACARRCSGVADRNAGFSRANPQKLYLPIILDPDYHYEAVNVEAQLAQPALAALVDAAGAGVAQTLARAG